MQVLSTEPFKADRVKENPESDLDLRGVVVAAAPGSIIGILG